LLRVTHVSLGCILPSFLSGTGEQFAAKHLTLHGFLIQYVYLHYSNENLILIMIGFSDEAGFQKFGNCKT
jgi:hypothetical protein